MECAAGHLADVTWRMQYRTAGPDANPGSGPGTRVAADDGRPAELRAKLAGCFLASRVMRYTVSRAPGRRVVPSRRMRALVGLLGAAALDACAHGSPVAPDGVRYDRLPPGAYYLRTLDGQHLPATLRSGERIESGFVVADSIEPSLVGFGETVGRQASSTARLATGTARILGEDYRSARIAAISWHGRPGASADSVLWSMDSVIVYRTGSAPSLAGEGHRLIYTRATPADTL
jgi:hypothetical protein